MLKTLFWPFISAEAIVGTFLTIVLLLSCEAFEKYLVPALLGIGVLFLVIALFLKRRGQNLEQPLAKDPASLLLLSMNPIAVGIRKLRSTIAKNRISAQWATAGVVLVINAWLLSSFALGSGI